MYLPIVDINTRQPINRGDVGQWGTKLNAIDLELSNAINELYERLLLSETYAGLDGGKASSVYTTIQIVNGGNA